MKRNSQFSFGLVMRASLTELTKETFTGKELDEETGLYYFGARYYDAALGRWSVMDPAGQFATPYAYANNPVSYVDPDGEFVQLVILGAMIGASLGSMQAGMRGEDPYRGMLKGAIIGGATSALGAAVQPVGMLSGAAFGGGVGGASYGAQTLLNGDAFNMSDFGRSVGIGAVTGAVDGGIRAHLRGNRNLLTGDYTASYKDEIRRNIIGGGFDPNGPIPISEAQSFAQKTHTQLYTEAGQPTIIGGKVPAGYNLDPSSGYFINSKGDFVGGVNLPNKIINGTSTSTIHIAPARFNKAIDLYLKHWFDGSMNRIFNLAVNSGIGDANRYANYWSEIQAHSWSFNQSRVLFYQPGWDNARLLQIRYNSLLNGLK